MRKIILSFFSLMSVLFTAQNLTPTPSISTSGSADNFKGGYTFAYASSGTAWNGALLSFGGLNNNYDTQLNADYGPHGGSHISFRTKNGDANVWNSWNELATKGENDFIGRQTIMGDLGIGTNNPQYKLDVIGKSSFTGNMKVDAKIEAKEIKVTLTPTADFVFAEDYALPKLEDIEKHIKEKKHLPEIASAKEMEKEGVNVGEFQIKLLQKIEELTLYTIEQNKQLKKQAEEIEVLKKQIKH